MWYSRVGFVRHGAVAQGGAFNCLSGPERRRYAEIRPFRRARWLAGRVLGKKLFLDAIAKDVAFVGGPAVREYDATCLGTYPGWLYREVEILPQSPESTGCPRINWAGARWPIGLSVSHAGDFTAACVDRNGAVGLDIEIPAERVPAFYAMSFTNSEKEWVAALCTDTRVGRESACMLLWCLKEAAVKSRESDDISLWNLASVEVRPAGATRDFGALLAHDGALGDAGMSCTVDVSEDGRTRVVEAMLSASRFALLACVAGTRE